MRSGRRQTLADRGSPDRDNALGSDKLVVDEQFAAPTVPVCVTSLYTSKLSSSAELALGVEVLPPVV